MTAGFTAIDLSKLPAPTIVEALSYEAIYADMLADFIARCATFGITFDVTLETEPCCIVLQAAAYREFLIRQRVNDAGRGVMLAYAVGTDLDNLGAVFGVLRLVITAATVDGDGNAVPAVMESDDAFRVRITLAPEGYSVAGPRGAYIFHALSASGDVLGATAASPSPGEVVVSILSRIGDGTASSPLLAAVTAYLSGDTVRPMTDHVTVQSATIVPYAITATITTYAGPDSATVMAAATAQLNAFVADARQLGRDITLSSLYAALTVGGVQNVVISSPSADVVIADDESANCTAITLTYGGVGG